MLSVSAPGKYVDLQRHIDAGANLPALLLTAAHFSGDLTILRPEWQPADYFGTPVSTLSAEQERIARTEAGRLIAEALKTGRPTTRPTFDLVSRMSTWFTGGEEVLPFVPLIAEEYATPAMDPRRPTWTKQQIAGDRPFRVAIVGAGEAGLMLAHRLNQAGIDFTIYDKNHDVGGTWLENDYPGCRVDINSFVYSYANKLWSWKEYYARQPEALEYLREFARENSIYDHASLGTEVLRAEWLEDPSAWNLTVRRDGAEQIERFDLVTFAVGQLNRPALPQIAGRESFAGAAFHSARWRHDLDLTGLRVGVIGNGASGVQFIPQVAQKAKHVTVFSRTAAWLQPTPDLHESLCESQAWLVEHLPEYARWYRLSILMFNLRGLLEQVTLDPDYPASERAVSAVNEMVRQAIVDWIEPQIADRPDLADIMIPTAPVGSKRIIRDNGSWAAALKRPNVKVVRNRIERIEAGGLTTADGVSHDLDVLIYGTGFSASQFLVPMEIIGRDGANLHKVWGESPTAYLGTVVAGFPNMFCIYGPNTNLAVAGGSAILFSELSIKYIVNSIRLLFESNAQSMEVTQEVMDSYDARVHIISATRAWGYSKVNTWYKNSLGKSTQNYPFTSAEYWSRTNYVVADDFHLTFGRNE